MRIKWSSIPRINAANVNVPWVIHSLTEGFKFDVLDEERERAKKEKSKKTQRVLAWLRRSRW